MASYPVALSPSEIPAVLLSLDFLSQMLPVVQALAFTLSVKGISKDKAKAGDVWVSGGGEEQWEAPQPC